MHLAPANPATAPSAGCLPSSNFQGVHFGRSCRGHATPTHAAAVQGSRLGYDPSCTQLGVLLSCFFFSHTDPKGIHAPWGSKPYASTPSPHRTPREQPPVPRDGIMSPPVHRTCCSHGTKHLLSQDKGVARGKLRDAKVPEKRWFALDASVPWDMQGCC